MSNIYQQKQVNEALKFNEREKDWRNGALVYQVIVDRFAQAENIAIKKHMYTPPKRLRAWSEVPAQGEFLQQYNVWSHEIDFWGGDLKSLESKLSYIKQLDIDVLYLNPIHNAYTNHKYDAADYLTISPEYGTHGDLKELIQKLHQFGMKIVLDGVFNHMGRNSDIFQEAASNLKSAYRDWFNFGSEYPEGVRLWQNAKSLPELNLENPEVREYIYAGEKSAIRSYLRDGVDGWRLDAAFELGFIYLSDLTEWAHKENPGSLVVGEIVNYPSDWFPAVDGVMNFTLREIILGSIQGKIEPVQASHMISSMIKDVGIESMLKSWIVLDNHDIPRIATLLPNAEERKLAQVLQFTLPGSPNLYYGSELGMKGAGDPDVRAPMRWDLVNAENEYLIWTKKLIQLRKNYRALKIGDYRRIHSSKLIAFERYTDLVQDTIIVIVNPENQMITENILVPDSKLMNDTKMVDLMSHQEPIYMSASILKLNVPAKSCLILQPQTAPVDGYSPYKRIQ